jgi:hypothetical protein
MLLLKLLLELRSHGQILDLALVRFGSPWSRSIFFRERTKNAHGDVGFNMHVDSSPTLSAILIDTAVAKS